MNVNNATIWQMVRDRIEGAAAEYYRRRAIRDARVRNPHPSKALFHARMSDRLRFYGRCGA